MGGLKLCPLDDVWRALDVCMPGCKRELKLHHWWVWPAYSGEPYRSIPKGPHGTTRPDIEGGHVRSLARQFGIEECMKR